MATKKKVASKAAASKAKKQPPIGLKELASDLRKIVVNMTEVMTDEEVLGLKDPNANKKWITLMKQGEAIAIMAQQITFQRKRK